MKVLVTGAGGFIGRHLIRQLSVHHEIFAVVRQARQVASDETTNIVVMDLAHELDTRLLPAQIDVIVHLAQANVRFPEGAKELLAVNTTATQYFLDYGRKAGAKQFILASTGDVYGRRLDLCKETDPLSPANFYAATKCAAEMLAQAYSDDLASCILRLFQPYGSGQANRLIPKLAERLRQHRAIEVHEGSHPFMTPIYIDDVIRAIESAIELTHDGVINIAGDRVISLRELAEEIGLVIGCQPIFKETGLETGDMMGDNSLMKKAFAEWPMVNLAQGLAHTLKVGEDTACQTRV